MPAPHLSWEIQAVAIWTLCATSLLLAHSQASLPHNREKRGEGGRSSHSFFSYWASDLTGSHTGSEDAASHSPPTCWTAFLSCAAAIQGGWAHRAAGSLPSSATSAKHPTAKKKKNRSGRAEKERGAIFQNIYTHKQQGIKMGRSSFNINANISSGALIMWSNLSREVV